MIDTTTLRISATQLRLGLLAVLLLLLPAGCAKVVSIVPQKAKHSESQNVKEIICLWRSVEGRGLDNVPTRGFAGQIVFLASGSPTPVEVEGDVHIYLFDDVGSAEQQARPIHTFNFVGGAWQAHQRETAWGPSYQLFIPYVRKGQHAAECTLVVRFQPKQGRPLDSDLGNVALVGKEEQTQQLVAPDAVKAARRQLQSGGPIRRASGEAPQFESFSIPVTNASQQQLR
jgi:hypothetical protein